MIQPSLHSRFIDKAIEKTGSRSFKSLIIKVGQHFKMAFPLLESLVVSRFKDSFELRDGVEVKISRGPNHSRLLLIDCLWMDTGEINIQLKNPFAAAEARSLLIVLGMKTEI